MPCLRRVSQLDQQGGGTQDEYAEMLMDLAEEAGEGGDGEEWVATHTNAAGARIELYDLTSNTCGRTSVRGIS